MVHLFHFLVLVFLLESSVCLIPRLQIDLWIWKLDHIQVQAFGRNIWWALGCIALTASLQEVQNQFSLSGISEIDFWVPVLEPGLLAPIEHLKRKL